MKDRPRSSLRSLRCSSCRYESDLQRNALAWTRRCGASSGDACVPACPAPVAQLFGDSGCLLPKLYFVLRCSPFGSASVRVYRPGANAGAIAGVVLAPDGNTVARASVALSAPDAPAHIITSADDGTFLLRDLPSGGYTIKTTSPSSAPDEESVSFAVGRTTHLSLHLAIAGTQQNVNATAGPVTFDTSQASSVVNIDRDRVEELPIPSRNYLTFVLLSPQVAAANPALQQQGLTASGVSCSFGGLRPGSNAIYLGWSQR